MKGLKRVRGKIIEKCEEGIFVKTTKRKPVYIAFSDMVQKNVSVMVWDHGPNSAEDPLSVGNTVDVMWWDSPVDYSMLLGEDEDAFRRKVPEDTLIDLLEEELPF